MSSISSTRSGTSNSSEPLAKRDREIESLKEEVRQLNETHRNEIARLQDENKKRIDQIHTEDNTKLNEKDIQHQKEIQAIRAMYTKRGAESET